LLDIVVFILRVSFYKKNSQCETETNIT